MDIIVSAFKNNKCRLFGSEAYIKTSSMKFLLWQEETQIKGAHLLCGKVTTPSLLTVNAFDGPSRVKSKLWPSSTTSNDFIILKVVAM